MNRPPLITLSSDFGVQTQGVGTMEAVAFSIAPQAKIVHLMHGISEFDRIAAARTMETVNWLPVGYHVCVCDPGVGTSRRAIALEVGRGDYFVGPDNGIFLPASRLLGGIKRAYHLTNDTYHRKPVSHVFHGRDIFAPVAAHLANGVKPTDLGPSLQVESLVAAPYGEATFDNGAFHAQIIQINRFGSMHLNILHGEWEKHEPKLGASIHLKFSSGKETTLPYGTTFGDVSRNENIIFKDDYGRIEIAKNQGRFIEEFPCRIGDWVDVRI